MSRWKIDFIIVQKNLKVFHSGLENGEMLVGVCEVLIFTLPWVSQSCWYLAVEGYRNISCKYIQMMNRLIEYLCLHNDFHLNFLPMILFHFAMKYEVNPLICFTFQFNYGQCHKIDEKQTK